MNRELSLIPASGNRPVFENYTFLLVDGNPLDLRDLKKRFALYAPNLHLASDFESALNYTRENTIHAVFCRWDGNEKWNALMESYFGGQPFGLFYFFMEEALLPHAPNLIKQGAMDCLTLPLDLEKILPQVFNGIRKRHFELSEVDPQFALLQKFILFRSPIMRKGLSMLPQVAKTDYSVLITGKTGTGKELVARAIHGLSSRKDQPFVALNCGAIQETLIESELFGHEKGSFTGASGQKKGKFELAHKGTLFLDEIGEMPMKLQVRLLRILEDGMLSRVGSERSFRVDVRVLAATRVDLSEAIEKGMFREDLFYRLNILHIHMPDLNQRREDIPLLATYFFQRTLREMERKSPFPYFAQKSLQLLSETDWEGNVRQLKNAMTRLAVLLPSDVRIIQPEMIAYLTGVREVMPVAPEQKRISLENSATIESTEAGNGVFIPFGTGLREAEDTLIQFTLEQNGGNKTKTAEMLGISLRNLRRKTNSGF